MKNRKTFNITSLEVTNIFLAFQRSRQ